eukprot:gene13479-15928_t
MYKYGLELRLQIRKIFGAVKTPYNLFDIGSTEGIEATETRANVLILLGLCECVMGSAGQAVFDEPWEFAKSNLHVVLVNPQIPGQNGIAYILLSCSNTRDNNIFVALIQVPLHLVGPLGFDIDDKAVKRAGLDYWPYVFVKLHETWDDFYEYFKQQEGEKRLVGFSKSGARAHWEPGAYRPGDWLLF